jgi:hypothetical protein
VGQDKGKARKYVASRSSNMKKGKKPSNNGPLIPPRDPTGLVAGNLINDINRAKTAINNVDRAMYRSGVKRGSQALGAARDVAGDIAQFASGRAKSVIRDAQGAAKMIMKGFGN